MENNMLDKVIDDIIAVEGDYVNHPLDRGGATRFGITEATARQFGYTEAMQDLPRELAVRIYRERYYFDPKIDKVVAISPAIGFKIMDFGVNSGPANAIKVLQQAISALSSNVTVDGNIGPQTLGGLIAYLKSRSNGGSEAILLKAINCLQGAFYVDIVKSRPASKAFINGWFAKRIA